MDRPQKTRLISAFVVLLLFLGINGVISQRSTRKLIQNEQRVAHTHEVLANLDQTLALLTEAESGQRGFILTGNEVYLENYKEDLHRLPEQLEKLKRLTADNPSQQRRVVRLEEEINQRIVTLNEVLNIARTEGMKAASRSIESNAGRVLMAEARATVNDMQAEEQRLLDIRARESRQSSFRTLLTFAAVNVITIGLVAALYLLFRRYLGLQQAATEELKRQQAALRVSYQRMELAQQASNFSVFQWDIPDNALSWFGDTQTIYGRHPSQLNSYRSWLEALHADDRDQVHEALQKLLRSGAPFAQEFRVIWPSGDEHWIAGMGRLFYENGRPQRLLGIHLDITDRRRAENALQSSEKLAATGRLAASIAHEINNPLEAVSNLLYLLSDNEHLDASSKQYTLLAQEELTRITHIVRQTLGFYREASQPVTVQISDVVKSVLELYKRKIESKRIFVRSDFTRESSIVAFPGEMRQVFSNLIANALDALPSGGKIDIRVRKAHNPGDANVPGVLCRISDNGEGIRRHNLRFIFEPFFTTKGEKGTGLGLWVTHGIVKKHLGWIRVRSSAEPERHGTTFLIFLPGKSQTLESGTQEHSRQISA